MIKHEQKSAGSLTETPLSDIALAAQLLAKRSDGWGATLAELYYSIFGGAEAKPTPEALAAMRQKIWHRMPLISEADAFDIVNTLNGLHPTGYQKVNISTLLLHELTSFFDEIDQSAAEINEKFNGANISVPIHQKEQRSRLVSKVASMSAEETLAILFAARFWWENRETSSEFRFGYFFRIQA